MKCRHCAHELHQTFVDLGVMPPSNAYLNHKSMFDNERSYPLKVLVCTHCWLVQTKDFTRAEELFTPDYAYFSSISSSWLHHAKRHVDRLIQERCLDSNSFVVELASNDGYLLQNFVQQRIPCLGVEPTAASASVARDKGIEVKEDFFCLEIAHVITEQYSKPDVVIANNVLAHVPEINDFVLGLAVLLSENSVATLEFPHLLNLIELNQFDTTYHEHFSYLSLIAIENVFIKAGLEIFDVEKIATHGGSLRVWVQKKQGKEPIKPSVNTLLEEERRFGIESLETYTSFTKQVDQVVQGLIDFLQNVKAEGKAIVAYGAAAKGNTILNCAGINQNDIQAVFDAAPSKQNKWLPGSHIPILAPHKLTEFKPDYVLILPWNIADEIIPAIKEQVPEHCQFVVAVPEIKLL